MDYLVADENYKEALSKFQRVFQLVMQDLIN